MRVLHVNPILNVSDIAATIGWFAKLGHGPSGSSGGDPGGPDWPGSRASPGGEHEIFLCRRAGRP